MKEELISKVISYNYNEFGNEFGDCIVDMKNEIERLNNIINEFEKYLEETKGIYEEYTCAIKRLKELKGSDKDVSVKEL